MDLFLLPYYSKAARHQMKITMQRWMDLVLKTGSGRVCCPTYHLIPLSSWTMPAITAFLTFPSRKIELALCVSGLSKITALPPHPMKKNLWEIIKKEKRNPKYYVIDQLATKYGHEVLRLPPYHCDLNPIELV